MSGAGTHDLMSVRLDQRRDSRATVVTVAGQIDIFTAPRLRDVLVEQIQAGHVHLVVDVEKVTFWTPPPLRY
jgi:anti-sigma B factor antagonist